MRNASRTAAYEWIATKMLKYLEDSEVMKVSTRELKEQVLSPDESSVNEVRIARQARGENSKKLFQIFRQGANEVFIASMARWEEQLKGLVVLEWHCLALKGKMNMQKTAPEDLQRQIFEELEGAEDKGSAGTRTKEAQVDQVGR